MTAAPGVAESALALALTETAAPKPVYVPSPARKITRRGVMWLGQTCNLRCHFCYFLDRIEDESHPEHGFIPLEKAKAICRTLVDFYGNNSVDIQGGEPTIWPPIYDLVAYCAEIGLAPTLITNAQALANRRVVARFKEAGIRDFLVSVQGLGPVYDGSWAARALMSARCGRSGTSRKKASRSGSTRCSRRPPCRSSRTSRAWP